MTQKFSPVTPDLIRKDRRKYLLYFVGKAFSFFDKHNFNDFCLNLKNLRNYLDTLCPDCEMTFLNLGQNYFALPDGDHSDEDYCPYFHVSTERSVFFIKDSELELLIDRVILYKENNFKQVTL
ncbi:MAG: hypothetical protein Q8788_02300 [Candidatus Phytoplasma australasiaticum]|nr:hypothetical protein [Candidatus Phytoplasma australasiaticum]MDV3148101.1 hypothetical protein [Candidatus Phytoplasma australasiaticum]MDV3153842.1 hypothetical protein [Candidatus Phytoplasma australasiaticum]